MASTQAMCLSFKRELLQGLHQLGVPAATVALTSRTSLTAPVNDTVKMALYSDTATLGANTTTWTTGTANGQLAAGNGYTDGGNTLTFVAPSDNATTTAFVGPSSGATTSWTGFTASNFSAALVYNATQGNKAISVHTFSPQSITAGTFTITFPTNAAGTALINLA